MESYNDFTKGKILEPLLKFAGPILLALFLQVMYGAVDLVVVGRFAQTMDISAVSTGSQIMQSSTMVLSTFAIGITVLLGQKIGEGNSSVAGKVVGTGIILFAAISAAFTVIFVTFTEAIATIMQAPKEAFEPTVEYVRICSAGTVFIIAFNLLGSIFRGIGDAKTPLLSVAIACVFNIFGDLLLVGIFNLGAAGAAYATISAQAISVAISIAIIRRRPSPFVLKKEDIRFDKELTKQLAKIGAPAALQDFLVGISFLVLLAIVNSLGLVQSAGMGVAEKLCGFIMLVSSAFMQSLSAFVAQNIGAKQFGRAKSALKCGILASLSAGVIMFYISFFHGDMLSAIFANEPDVILMAADYLKAYSIDTLLTAFLFCFLGYYTGCGRTAFVMLQGTLSAFLVRIPLAYLISKISGATLFHIGLATPCSSLVQIVLCIVYFYVLERRRKGCHDGITNQI